MLRDLREKRRWTQSELADRLHTSRRTVNSLGRGKRTPNLMLAFRIAAVLKRPVEELFRSPPRRLGAVSEEQRRA